MLRLSSNIARMQQYTKTLPFTAGRARTLTKSIGRFSERKQMFAERKQMFAERKQMFAERKQMFAERKQMFAERK